MLVSRLSSYYGEKAAKSLFYVLFRGEKKGSSAQQFLSSRAALIFLYSPCKNRFQICYRTWISLSVLRLTHPCELFPGRSSPQIFKHHKCFITDIHMYRVGMGFTFTKKNTFRKYLHVCTCICLQVYQTYNISKNIPVICTKKLLVFLMTPFMYIVLLHCTLNSGLLFSQMLFSYVKVM